MLRFPFRYLTTLLTLFFLPLTGNAKDLGIDVVQFTKNVNLGLEAAESPYLLPLDMKKSYDYKSQEYVSIARIKNAVAIQIFSNKAGKVTHVSTILDIPRLVKLDKTHVNRALELSALVCAFFGPEDQIFEDFGLMNQLMNTAIKGYKQSLGKDQEQRATRFNVDFGVTIKNHVMEVFAKHNGKDAPAKRGNRLGKDKAQKIN